MVSTFQFELEKYNGAKSRFHCPSCGEKKQFARYIDLETNRYVSDNVGICNRVAKCNYHYTPKQFYIDNPTNSNETEYKKPKRIIPQPKQKPAGRIAQEILERTLGKAESHDNQLFEWLVSLFHAEVAVYLFDTFLIGTTKDSKPIFWQVDKRLSVRTGKIIETNRNDGKRQGLDWIHSRMKKANLLADDWQLQQCYFGLHQLNLPKNEGKIIALVEGEKTAVVMTALHPNYIWLATGGCSGFNIEKTEPLKGRKIVVCPDAGAFQKWSEKADKVRKLGYRISVVKAMEEKLEQGLCKPNDDFLDLYLITDNSGFAVSNDYPTFWDL